MWNVYLINVFLILDSFLGTSNNGLQMDLLWTNSNTSVNFEPTTINLDWSHYSYLYIVAQNHNDLYETGAHLVSIWINTIDINKPYLLMGAHIYNNTIHVTTRRIILVSNGVDVKTAYDNASQANQGLIPYKIYGVK